MTAMSVGLYYKELKREFDLIQAMLDYQKQNAKPTQPAMRQPIRRRTGAEMQAIKDEVKAEETHAWTFR
jgi:hypothetical protein